MSTSRKSLKLGKGAAFVKSRLRRLPQFDDIWEADMQPVLGKHDRTEFWLGMVVEQEHGAMPANRSFDQAPTVNDLARLLADAMYRPLSEDRQHRPASVLLRRNPEWDELLPQLREIGVEVVLTGALPAWTEAAKEFGVQTAQALRGLVAKAVGKKPPILESSFPTVSKWVQRGGWIEIGDQNGFAARAFDAGGLVFEDTAAATLDEAMAALELGISDWLEEHGVDLG